MGETGGVDDGVGFGPGGVAVGGSKCYLDLVYLFVSLYLCKYGSGTRRDVARVFRVTARSLVRGFDGSTTGIDVSVAAGLGMSG